MFELAVMIVDRAPRILLIAAFMDIAVWTAVGLSVWLLRRRSAQQPGR